MVEESGVARLAALGLAASDDDITAQLRCPTSLSDTSRVGSEWVLGLRSVAFDAMGRSVSDAARTWTTGLSVHVRFDDNHAEGRMNPYCTPTIRAMCKPMAFARPGGTAFPICLAISILDP